MMRMRMMPDEEEDNNNSMGGPTTIHTYIRICTYTYMYVCVGTHLGEALDLGLGEEALQVAMASVHCPTIIIIILIIEGTYLQVDGVSQSIVLQY